MTTRIRGPATATISPRMGPGSRQPGTLFFEDAPALSRPSGGGASGRPPNGLDSVTTANRAWDAGTGAPEARPRVTGARSAARALPSPLPARGQRHRRVLRELDVEAVDQQAGRAWQAGRDDLDRQPAMPDSKPRLSATVPTALTTGMTGTGSVVAVGATVPAAAGGSRRAAVLARGSSGIEATTSVIASTIARTAMVDSTTTTGSRERAGSPGSLAMCLAASRMPALSWRRPMHG